MFQDAIALARVWIVAAMKTVGAGEERLFLCAQPGDVTGVLSVRDGTERPVQELLHRHVTEATFDAVAFVAGVTGGCEEIIHAHVVGE